MQIGARTRSGIDLGSGSRLRRMRPLGAPQRALDRDLGGLGLWPDVWLRELLDMHLPMDEAGHAA